MGCNGAVLNILLFLFRVNSVLIIFCVQCIAMEYVVACIMSLIFVINVFNYRSFYTDLLTFLIKKTLEK